MDAIEAAEKVMIDEDDPSAGCVHIRVGIHSGAVVSNVIGSLNPRYGLFGDTVNTASRMESLSVSGRIQASESAAKLLKVQAPNLPLTKRGKVAVKGKGNMITFWVGAGDHKSTVPTSSFDEPRPVVNFSDAPQVFLSPVPVRANPARTTMAGYSGGPVKKHRQQAEAFEEKEEASVVYRSFEGGPRDYQRSFSK